MTEQSNLAFVTGMADAITSAAARAGALDPAVRGADWRQGIVTDIFADGTVEIDDVLIARRLESYQNPILSTRVIVSLSSRGDWIALGRMSAGGDTSWATPSLTAGYSHDGNSNGTLQWRAFVRGGSRYVEFRGGVNVPASVGTGASTIFTLPADARPASRRSIPVAKNGECYKIDVNTNGNVSIASGATSAWTWCAINGICSL